MYNIVDKFERLYEMNNFQKKNILPKSIQEETENLNNSITK